MADLSLPHTAVFEILRDDLEFKVVVSCWVLHLLSDTNKRERVVCCRTLLKLFRHPREPFLGSHLFVQDESWFYWDSTERRKTWVDQNGKRYTTPRPKQTKRKMMILMGFTCKPKRVSVQALPAGTTATRKTKIEYL